MRWILTMVLATLLPACAGPRDRGGDARDVDRMREERREQERLCELYARQGRPDANCPDPPAPPPDTGPRVNLPPVLGPNRR